MKSWWKRLGACVSGLLMGCQALAAAESGRMPRKDAVDMAAQIVEAVETQALPPIDPAVQARAKAALLRTVSSGGAGDLDRATVYAAARLYLLTIASGGHTFLWSRQYTQSYAMDGEPVIRGSLQRDFPADFAETPEQSLQRAATWAEANSPLCRSR